MHALVQAFWMPQLNHGLGQRQPHLDIKVDAPHRYGHS